MTFSRQLKRTQIRQAAADVFCGAVIIACALQQEWLPALVLAAAAGLFSTFERRRIRQAKPLKDLGDCLRGIDSTVPSGHARIYVSQDSDLAVRYKPSTGRMTADIFTTFDVRDLMQIDREAEGSKVHLPITNYTVLRLHPTIWRHVTAEEAVKGQGEGDYHAAGSARPTSWQKFLRVVLLNHRTGVMIPDADELRQVVKLVKNADRTWDTAITP